MSVWFQQCLIPTVKVKVKARYPAWPRGAGDLSFVACAHFPGVNTLAVADALAPRETSASSQIPGPLCLASPVGTWHGC